MVQSPSGVRFEWGPAGADRLVKQVACLVVVDVLSFITTVSVAVQQGTRVLPFWQQPGPATPIERAGAEQAAEVFARQSGARLTVHRHAVTADRPWSLSPAHVRHAPFVARLVLPSPNVAAICAAVPSDVRLVAACPRSITAVGGWLTARGYGAVGHPVAVIAAGERWPEGSLRPVLKGLLGVGSLIWELYSQGTCPLSAEAAAAKAGYEGTADLAHTTAAGVSGRQLAAAGFTEDVVIAAEEDTCTVVPVRDGDGAFASG
jgi:2-phosphosulfolactate phosphatase